ncbi:hypothetical protein ACFPRL_17500 [Pseudoclavibacter helvolus]
MHIPRTQRWPDTCCPAISCAFGETRDTIRGNRASAAEATRVCPTSRKLTGRALPARRG